MGMPGPTSRSSVLASRMTGQEEVLDLLGAALGDGVRHPGQADETELILSGLARLRQAHTQLLNRLGPERPQADDGSMITWGPEAVGVRVGMTEDQANRLLFGLASSGFMTMHGAFGGLGFTVNDRGLRLLEVIEALKDDDARQGRGYPGQVRPVGAVSRSIA
jgi:hypothetical protein